MRSAGLRARVRARVWKGAILRMLCRRDGGSWAGCSVPGRTRVQDVGPMTTHTGSEGQGSVRLVRVSEGREPDPSLILGLARDWSVPPWSFHGREWRETRSLEACRRSRFNEKLPLQSPGRFYILGRARRLPSVVMRGAAREALSQCSLVLGRRRDIFLCWATTLRAARRSPSAGWVAIRDDVYIVAAHNQKSLRLSSHLRGRRGHAWGERGWKTCPGILYLILPP